ncbi:MAG: RIP metalloprotease RseP [bacterium]
MLNLPTIVEFVRIAAMIVIAFGLVILLHELGHFIMAKIAGVDAPEFAIGMGPEVAGFTWGGTRYKVCLFPIGGYVKIVGEDQEEAPGTPPERNFINKSTPVKISVFFAGPFMNYVLGFVFFASIYLIWGVPRELPVGDVYSERVVIAFPDPRKPAAKAGMRQNDTVLTVDGTPVKSREHFITLIGERAERETVVGILRGDKRFTVRVVPFRDETLGRGRIGVQIDSPVPRRIKSVDRDSPAWNAGLRPGDILLDVNDQVFLGERYKFSGAIEVLKFTGEKKKPREIRVAAPGGGETDMGVAFDPVFTRASIGTALGYGLNRTVSATLLLYVALRMLVEKKLSIGDVAGPVGIIQYASIFARSGLMDFFAFFGLISVNLAVINLIPFPALDGSRIMFHTLEALVRRPLDPRRMNFIHTVGLIILIALIAAVTLSDVMHLL